MRDRPSREARPRPRRWVLKALVALVVAWLVVDKAASVVAPEPQVGHWRSAGAQEAYAVAYRDVMAELPAPTRVLDIQTEHGSIRVLEWMGEEAGPPVLLVPGMSSGAPMWSENLPAWIGKRTMYALDPLGDAGFSSQRLPLTGFEAQAQWIGEAVPGLGLGRVHVVGHSFGGATAAMYALKHPEQVASLTLLEPVWVIESFPVSTFWWATVALLPVPQSWRDRALAEIGGTTVAEVRERTPMSVMIDAAAQGYSAGLPLPRRLTDDEWGNLVMPLRVDIAGTKSLAGGQRAVDRMRALRPGATVTLWPAATHSLPMQEREAIGSALLEFWRASS